MDADPEQFAAALAAVEREDRVEGGKDFRAIAEAVRETAAAED